MLYLYKREERVASNYSQNLALTKSYTYKRLIIVVYSVMIDCSTDSFSTGFLAII